MSCDVKMFTACDHKVRITQKEIINIPIFEFQMNEDRISYFYYKDNDGFPINIIDKNGNLVYAKTDDNYYIYAIDKNNNNYAYIKQQYATKYKVINNTNPNNDDYTEKISDIFNDNTSIPGLEFKLNDKNLKSGFTIQLSTYQKKNAKLEKDDMVDKFITNLKIIDERLIDTKKTYVIEIIVPGTPYDGATYKVYDKNSPLSDIILSKNIYNSFDPNTISIAGVSFIVNNTSDLLQGDKAEITLIPPKRANFEIDKYLDNNNNEIILTHEIQSFLFNNIKIIKEENILDTQWDIKILEANILNTYTYNKIDENNEYKFISKINEINDVLEIIDFNDIRYDNKNIIKKLINKYDVYYEPIYDKKIIEKDVMLDFNQNPNKINDRNNIYVPSNCPKCYGSGVYFDIAFDNYGDAILVEDSLKLQQEIFKIIMQEKGENLFHKEYGIELSNRIVGTKNTSLVKAKLEFIVMQAISHLFELQQEQKQTKGNTIPGELLKNVEAINVVRTGPTTYSVSVSIKAEDETNLQATVSYNL